MEEEKIGEVVKYLDEAGVAVVKLNGSLKPGEKVHFRGKADFEQTIDSIEVDNQKIDEGSMGQEVGIKANSPCEAGDMVFKVFE
ncbi:MAG: hypothetical protein ACQESF_04795 [Nanobdellota archaeon]